MDNEMREKVAEIVTDAAMSYVPGEVDNEFDHWSAVGSYAAGRILSLITAELERVERERDAAQARLAEAVEVMRPFTGLARAVTDEGSPDFREWVREAKDWTVVFSFAGQSVTLGELRSLGRARAFMAQQKDGDNV